MHTLQIKTYLFVVVVFLQCLCVISTFSVWFIGKPFNPQPVINKAVSNIIACLVFGERFEYTDKQLEDILQDINDIVILEGSAWAQVSHLSNHLRH